MLDFNKNRKKVGNLCFQALTALVGSGTPGLAQGSQAHFEALKLTLWLSLALWLTVAHSGSLLLTPAHFGSLWHTPAHSGLLWLTLARTHSLTHSFTLSLPPSLTH